MAAPDREVDDEWGRSTLADRIEDAVDRLDYYRGRPSVAIAGVGLIAALVVAGWWFGRTPQATPVEELIPQVSLATTAPPTTEPAELVVHVAGAVALPGVYALPDGARIIDAVDMAGGALPGADTAQLNLAAQLSDGMQIRVPLEGEVLAAPVSSDDGSGGAGSGPVSLNRASASDLEELPGVGPATAEAIVSWRTEHGPFAIVEDLLNVPGIGPAKLAALSDLVVAG